MVSQKPKQNPKNITEELIDQALYEAQYIKKDMDNNELKSKITLNARIKEKKHS